MFQRSLNQRQRGTQINGVKKWSRVPRLRFPNEISKDQHPLKCPILQKPTTASPSTLLTKSDYYIFSRISGSPRTPLQLGALKFPISNIKCNGKECFDSLSSILQFTVAKPEVREGGEEWRSHELYGHWQISWFNHSLRTHLARVIKLGDPFDHTRKNFNKLGFESLSRSTADGRPRPANQIR